MAAKAKKAAAPKAEFPKPLVRVTRGVGGYESEVRTVADADGETAAKAAGFQAVEVTEPGADFVEYPKMLYHDPDAAQRIVQSAEEEAAANGDGYDELPPGAEEAAGGEPKGGFPSGPGRPPIPADRVPDR